MRRFAWWAGAAVVAAVMIVALVWSGGSPQQSTPGLPDAGRVVGWAVPLIGLFTRLASMTTVGLLVAATFLLSNRSGTVEGLSAHAVGRASVAAGIWAAATAVQAVVTAAEVFGELTPNFLEGFVTDTSLGRAFVVQTVLAGLVAVLCRTTVVITRLALITALAVGALLPVSLTGHSAVTGAHDLATVSLFVHVVGASLWVGGLTALTWIAVRGSKRLAAAVERYGRLALWSFCVVAISGVVNASTRLTHLSDLASSAYGRLVVLKTVMLLILGVAGWCVRRCAVNDLRGFVRLVSIDVLLMGCTVALAVALGRTPTPVSSRATSPVEELLGGPMPPTPTTARLLWGWEPTGVALTVVLLGGALYLAGLRVLLRRGDRWPIGRMVAWIAGIAVVAWAGVGGLSQYAHVMFSAHMGSHMMLAMVAPILLVLGAPVTLALRTLPGPREPGEMSPRGLLVALLHSRFSRVVTHPIVGPTLFVGSLFVLYFTGLFGVLMRTHWGHGAMQLHFLVVGALYYYVIIGVDPSPRSLPPIVRFGILMFTIPFHAFFSVALMSDKSVIAYSYWHALHRPYATDLLRDQYVGGGISWAMGEVPLILVFCALFVQWIKTDVREARRRDRAADRYGDADLEAYNKQLRRLAQRKP